MAFSIDIALAMAIWLELFAYGIYTVLFYHVVGVLWKNKSRRQSHGALIFMFTTLLMYILASVHMGLNLSRFLRAFVLREGQFGPAEFFYDFKRWETILNYFLFCGMTWVGDSLVIYRCYIVWNKNTWIIVLPVMVLASVMSLSIYAANWYIHDPLNTIEVLKKLPVGLLPSIYPLAVVQNVLTTGLIAWKIWAQHRASVSHGISGSSSSLSLLHVVRIIIESAMIYTVQSVLLMILAIVENPAQFIFQYLIVPSIGIVFAFMTLRLDQAKVKSEFRGPGHSTALPTWLNEDDSVIEFNPNRSIPPPDVVSFSVRTDHPEGLNVDDHTFPSSFHSRKDGKTQPNS